ncbi:hypothetical protein PAECIP111893_05318 [Paenibacillus plantiphilus]|uniref:Uncharacterized protein n=1 Tax=Paenibacillus plantiphilus TaxID=2905650 RepID=A0ABM9CXU8_9BACL|nr:hypothetical protein [Paenibacillus plantiphilus]CAH1226049.1 hypothetical protein PAECIP111893_05318 [Paenibacillus plantiphilus]
MIEKTKEELFEEYSRLEEEETRLFRKVATCEECVSGILGQLYRYGDKIDLLTLEDVLTLVHNKELELRTELLHLQLTKMLVSFRHSKATGENRPLEDRDED